MAALTLARVWSYCELSVFLSKSEAAKWAIKQLSGKSEREVLKAALAVFEEESETFAVEQEEFRAFASSMLHRIEGKKAAEAAKAATPLHA
ncbi:hypothetical protein A7K91_09915 [Paenibacillus oryzae]|uniref:Adenylyltransferase AadA C-terminal domain-containing protein n=2 Tax=Paenibacillus oryzae TaxID=1844972 RepID=A0A1A5YSX2_9BACL|nr:hypothetical protein A7K91_09915 [Paenibacillus oryzae]